MPKGFKYFKYLLVATCKITKFVIKITIKLVVDQVISEALIHRFICIFSPPKLFKVDTNSVNMGEVLQLILSVISFQMMIIRPFNHTCLRTKGKIETIGNIVTIYLTAKE